MFAYATVLLLHAFMVYKLVNQAQSSSCELFCTSFTLQRLVVHRKAVACGKIAALRATNTSAENISVLCYSLTGVRALATCEKLYGVALLNCGAVVCNTQAVPETRGPVSGVERNRKSQVNVEKSLKLRRRREMLFTVKGKKRRAKRAPHVEDR